jgi:hypothetical protein
MRTVSYNARGRQDRDVSQWLAARPAGGVLDLPMVTDNFEDCTIQYGTLCMDTRFGMDERYNSGCSGYSAIRRPSTIGTPGRVVRMLPRRRIGTS